MKGKEKILTVVAALGVITGLICLILKKEPYVGLIATGSIMLCSSALWTMMLLDKSLRYRGLGKLITGGLYGLCFCYLCVGIFAIAGISIGEQWNNQFMRGFIDGMALRVESLRLIAIVASLYAVSHLWGKRNHPQA